MHARLRIGSTLACLSLVAAPALAMPDFHVRVEPGVAVPLADPQASLYGVGGSAGLRAGVQVVKYLDFDIAGTYLGLSQGAAPDMGSAFTVGGGPALKLPLADGKAQPWLNADALYVRTGALDRFGYDVGAGVTFPVGERRSFDVGPYARYMQITQASMPGFNTADAKIIVAGVQLGVRTPRPAPIHDRDFDGIVDALDKCPDEAEDKDGFEDEDGCPDVDNDKDGVVDKADKCPMVAEDRDGFEDQDGCPDDDNDKDGIADKADKCPDQAEDRDGFEDQDGCPDLDNDKDGIADAKDACPDQPGPEVTSGCPDHDGDGIADKDDACPDVAGQADNHGCPHYQHVQVTEKQIVIDQKIFFAFDKTQILPRSYPVLDEVVTALHDAPSLRVRIEGHTDSKGKLDHNMKLSDGRAGAVRTYLVAHGIATDRLESKGYGPTVPLDTNKTAAGRENNRRVEFVILK